MIADPEGPSFITRTVGRRRYADNASVSHDPKETLLRRTERTIGATCRREARVGRRPFNSLGLRHCVAMDYG